jgi:cytochrome P450
MERILKDEFAALDREDKGAGSLITSLTRALKDSKVRQNAGKPTTGLSVDEIYGNVSVINFTGHDTTANTLAFSMALLAASPEVQTWVAQEVSAVVAQTNGNWEYARIYPQLVRCRAVLVSQL